MTLIVRTHSSKSIFSPSELDGLWLLPRDNVSAMLTWQHLPLSPQQVSFTKWGAEVNTRKKAQESQKDKKIGSKSLAIICLWLCHSPAKLLKLQSFFPESSICRDNLQSGVHERNPNILRQANQSKETLAHAKSNASKAAPFPQKKLHPMQKLDP